MDLITFKFFCINIYIKKRVAWILGKSSSWGYQKYFCWWRQNNPPLGSWIKYINEVDSSRMRHLCGSCTQFDDSEASLGVPWRFSMGKSWKKSTSSALISWQSARDAFRAQLWLSLYLLCLRMRLGVVSGGTPESSVSWRGPGNM